MEKVVLRVNKTDVINEDFSKNQDVFFYFRDIIKLISKEDLDIIYKIEDAGKRFDALMEAFKIKWREIDSAPLELIIEE